MAEGNADHEALLINVDKKNIHQTELLGKDNKPNDEEAQSVIMHE
jgi:hypothetical protein